MHLGNASTALLAWLSVRARGGAFVLRMEDLDGRAWCRGSAEGILNDLRWLGFDWEEGPDVGGPHRPYAQSERVAIYDAAFENSESQASSIPVFAVARTSSLRRAHLRRRRRVRYPWNVPRPDADDALRRIASGRAHAFRFRVESAEVPAFTDRVRGRFEAEPGLIGDFVVRRADGVAAYQLAVVADDIAMEIDEVVRGDDLLSSTVRQLLLYRAFDARPPSFAHVPLILGNDGIRLSKRHQGVTLHEMRESGQTAEEIVGRLAHHHRLRPTPAPVSASDLIRGFDLAAL
jgi:glutamyl-tRNA synthetase